MTLYSILLNRSWNNENKITTASDIKYFNTRMTNVVKLLL